jgi:hypothetical protein
LGKREVLTQRGFVTKGEGCPEMVWETIAFACKWGMCMCIVAFYLEKEYKKRRKEYKESRRVRDK